MERLAHGTVTGSQREQLAAAPGVVVDAHAHILVADATTDNADEAGWRVPVRRIAGRVRVLQNGSEYTAVTREFVDPAVMAAEAAGRGIQHQLLSPWVRLLPYQQELPMAREICRIQNAALAAIVAASPERFSAVGAVPLQDPPAAADMLEESRSMGLAGAEVGTNVGGRFLGDPAYEPFWRAADATAAVVFIHPFVHGLGIPALQADHLWNTVGNPVETAISAAHLILSGVVERYPRARILIAHGGGALWAARGRLRRAFEAVPGGRGRLREPPEVSMRSMYYDTVTHDPILLRRLVADAGAGHVLLGSDRPFNMGSDDPVTEVKALGLPPADEAGVLGGNALALLGPSPSLTNLIAKR